MKQALAILLCAALLLSMTACGNAAPASAEASEGSATGTDLYEIPADASVIPASSAEDAEAAEASEAPEIEEIPEESDDDVILGDTEARAGDTLELSVVTEGLNPLYQRYDDPDSSFASTGNIGKNSYAALGIITSEGMAAESNPDMAEIGEIGIEEATDVVLHNDASGTNGIIVSGAPYAIKNADLVLTSVDDGKNTSDFVGKGTAIMATGADANVTVENSNIDVTGVGRLAACVDNGATLTVRNSRLYSRGGTLYESYHNTATISKMVSPPWVLGIMGTSRCTNLMGTNSTLNVIDSETAAGSWAGLSTDSGTNVHLNVYNTSIEMLNKDESEIPVQAAGGQVEALDNPYTTRYGSGYGAFTIGQAVEVFAGATIHVGTMANILTGGTVTYTGLEKGKTYTLESGSGNTNVEYTATEDKNTVIESDTNGFMIHQNTNTLNVLSGTEVNSNFTGVLMKTGSSSSSINATFEKASLNVGNGVLVQLMDNDDALLGGMDGDGYFYDTYTETAGFLSVPEEADGTLASETADMGPGSVPSTGSETSSFTFRSMELEGNLYNAGGWYGGLVGIPMNVSLEDTTLNGAIATTTAIHVDYEGAVAYAERKGVAFDDDAEAEAFAKQYQATEYSISSYWIMGQVVNKIAYNGSNVINVSLSGNSVWNVESTSKINSLTLADTAKVVVPAGVTLNVDGTEYTDCVLSEAGVYGTVVEPGESAAGSGFAFPGGFSGPPPGGAPGFGGAADESEDEAEPEVVYTYIWTVDDASGAVLHDNEDGTVTVTPQAAGTVKVRVEVIADGVSTGRFVKVINIAE